jgi:hypothetical protein
MKRIATSPSKAARAYSEGHSSDSPVHELAGAGEYCLDFEENTR